KQSALRPGEDRSDRFARGRGDHRPAGRPGDRDRAVPCAQGAQGRQPGGGEAGGTRDERVASMNRLIEVFRVSVAAILAHKLRSTLTLLGVVIGVATIIIVVSAIAGLNRYVEEQVFTLSPDVFIVSKFGIITGRDQFLAALRRKNITIGEMERTRD